MEAPEMTAPSILPFARFNLLASIVLFAIFALVIANAAMLIVSTAADAILDCVTPLSTKLTVSTLSEASFD